MKKNSVTYHKYKIRPNMLQSYTFVLNQLLTGWKGRARRLS